MSIFSSIFGKPQNNRPFQLNTRRAQLRVESLETRLAPYAVSGNAWPHPELVTISIAPDGTDLGGIGSNLVRSLNARFGSQSVWQDQILKAAQAWAQQTNLNFSFVADNGAPAGAGSYQQGGVGMGDIRIYGYNFGGPTLAAAYLPPPVNNYSIAGDVVLNTGQTFNIGSTYDLFTVFSHEIGHALGFVHSSIITATMYSAYTGNKPALTSDDIAGIRSIYSNNNPRTPDGYNYSNYSVQTAADLTPWISPITKLVIGGAMDITSTSQVEFFTAVAPLGTSSQLKVTVQSSGLSLLSPAVYVYDSSINLVGWASGAGQRGTTLNVTVNGVTAGARYYVGVVGADSSPFGTGKYAFAMNFGPYATPAVPPPNTVTANGNPLSGGGGIANKVGQQFMVNSYVYSNQQTFAETPQAVAADANGNFMVTWASQGQDGSGWGIFAQRYDSTGAPVGSEFQVNTTTAGDQMYPAVAMNGAGSSVVTWSSYGQVGRSWGVFAQRYDPSGKPLGGEFQVNTTTAGDQMYSTVAMDAAGNFVITWSSYGPDGSGWGVFAQRYDMNANPIGGEFQVNTTTAGDQMYSTVAMNAAGSFVITWSSYGQGGAGWDVYGQRYDANGVPQGGEFQVNIDTAGDRNHSSVAMDAAGDFVVAWQSYGQDGNGWGVYARRFRADGTASKREYLVNTTTDGDQSSPTVAMDSTGDFVITWTSVNTKTGVTVDPNTGIVNSSGLNGISLGSLNQVPLSLGQHVFLQQFSSMGPRLGSELMISFDNTGNQKNSSVVVNDFGHIVVVWTGTDATGTANHVYAQRFETSQELNPEASVDTFSTVPHSRDQGPLFGAAAQLPQQQVVRELHAPPAARLLPEALVSLQTRAAWAGNFSDQPSRIVSAGVAASEGSVDSAIASHFHGRTVFEALRHQTKRHELPEAITSIAKQRSERNSAGTDSDDILVGSPADLILDVNLGAAPWSRACENCFGESAWEGSSSDFGAADLMAGQQSGDLGEAIATVAVALFLGSYRAAPTNDDEHDWTPFDRSAWN